MVIIGLNIYNNSCPASAAIWVLSIVALIVKKVFYHKIIIPDDDSCMVSSLCLEMNLSDFVMSALGPAALVQTSLDQTDSFSRHSDDTMHSSSFGVMISVNVIGYNYCRFLP